MMKEFQLYTGARTQTFHIPEQNFLYYAERPEISGEKSETEIIREGIKHPIGGVSLEQIPQNAKVVILVDDATRPTPTKKVLPYS